MAGENWLSLWALSSGSKNFETSIRGVGLHDQCPASASRGSLSARSPFADRPASDPKAGLSDQLSDDRRTHPRTPADVGGHSSPGRIREHAPPRSQATCDLRGWPSSRRTAAKYSNAYEPSCLPSRLSAWSVFASETSV